ncbi:unnamed protein product [Lymnaea stagnalis]|uniref:Chitin-binding type-2 domain-containing protein n=1 Tax=Lymnaea stagnalis TaxID=6523 RepID=A0AAV2H6Q0_LYMST
MHCPLDLVFDPIKLTCTFRNEATSCLDHNDYIPVPGHTTSAPPASTTHADLSYVCRQNNWNSGTFPHPYDCAYYLICANYLTTVVACPAGLVYDPISGQCASPHVAAPCNDVQTTTNVYTTSQIATTTSPHYDLTNVCRQFNLPDGIYPDPGSCVHFVECVATLTYHLECPEGLQFNSKILICDDVHHINCGDNYNFAFEHIQVG